VAVQRLISVPAVLGLFPKVTTVILGDPWLFIGFSDDCRFFILGFGAVLVFVLVVIWLRSQGYAK
jgi:hypothetical protein